MRGRAGEITPARMAVSGSSGRKVRALAGAFLAQAFEAGQDHQADATIRMGLAGVAGGHHEACPNRPCDQTVESYLEPAACLDIELSFITF